MEAADIQNAEFEIQGENIIQNLVPPQPNHLSVEALLELDELENRFNPNLDVDHLYNFCQMAILFEVVTVCYPIGTVALMLSQSQCFRILRRQPNYLYHWFENIIHDQNVNMNMNHAFHLSLLTNIRRAHSVNLYIFTVTGENIIMRWVDFRIMT